MIETKTIYVNGRQYRVKIYEYDDKRQIKVRNKQVFSVFSKFWVAEDTRVDESPSFLDRLFGYDESELDSVPPREQHITQVLNEAIQKTESLLAESAEMEDSIDRAAEIVEDVYSEELSSPPE